MGDAYRAFRLLTTDNASEISEIISEIESDNERRKNYVLYCMTRLFSICKRADMSANDA